MTGFPILGLGHVVLDTPWDALVPFVGTRGTGFFVAYFAAALASGWLVLGTTVGAVVLLLSLNLFQFVERGESHSVGVVQVNIPLSEKWYLSRTGESRRLYQSLSESLPPQDLVLWSEAAFAKSRVYMLDELQRYLNTSQHGAIATGYIEVLEDERNFNSLLLAERETSSHYRKHRLVPFGEYVPFEDLLRGLIDFFDLPYSSLQGDRFPSPSLPSSKLSFTGAICYEASFESDVGVGFLQSDPDAILVVSEDAWFGDSLAPHQNFEMVRMRALEHGRWVIRAANSGISGVVDPDGEVVAQAEQFVRTTLSAEISQMSGRTPYSMVSSIWISTFFVLLFFSAVIYHCRKRLNA